MRISCVWRDLALRKATKTGTRGYAITSVTAYTTCNATAPGADR